MQADAPLVSVIIPVYNGEAFVVEAVNSALAQTYSNLEVVIVDDGSPDNAAKLVQTRYQDEARVRLVRQPNTGTAAARNTGIRYARGTLIALLDQDDRWLPEKLVRQVPLFDDPQVGLVHTGGCVVDVETGRITSTYHAAEQLALPDLVRWCKVGCATTLIRRDVLDQIGLFNPDLGGVDDWDMWIRIAAAGYKVRGIAEPLVEIREHTDNQGKRFEQLYSRVLTVIENTARFDALSPDVVAARAAARRRLRQDYYVKACRRAALAARRGRLHEAAAYRLKALRRYPEALGHLPRRILRRHALTTSA